MNWRCLERWAGALYDGAPVFVSQELNQVESKIDNSMARSRFLLAYLQWFAAVAIGTGTEEGVDCITPLTKTAAWGQLWQLRPSECECVDGLEDVIFE